MVPGLYCATPKAKKHFPDLTAKLALVAMTAMTLTRYLELRQYGNDSIWSKDKLNLN